MYFFGLGVKGLKVVITTLKPWHHRWSMTKRNDNGKCYQTFFFWKQNLKRQNGVSPLLVLRRRGNTLLYCVVTSQRKWRRIHICPLCHIVHLYWLVPFYRQMRDIRHENLTHFFGACIEIDQVLVVNKFVKRNLPVSCMYKCMRFSDVGVFNRLLRLKMQCVFLSKTPGRIGKRGAVQVGENHRCLTGQWHCKSEYFVGCKDFAT